MTYTTADTAHRHLVLIDIENLVANPSPTPREVEMVNAALQRAVPDLSGAQCVVACSHHAAPAVAFSYPKARRLWRSGPDGADQALIEVLDQERVDQRFGRVTICSGDGIFSESTARLGQAGVDVTVVALHCALAGRLRMAASNVIELPCACQAAVGRAS